MLICCRKDENATVSGHNILSKTLSSFFFRVGGGGQKLVVLLIPVLKRNDFVECSCGRKQSGGYLEGAAPDGVMGLGPGSISVPSLLAKAGLIQNSFSICFNENDSGRILFGDQGHATQQSTSFLPVDGELYVLYKI